MPWLRWMLLGCTVVSSGPALALPLAESGRATCPILVAADAPAPERSAAEALAGVLEEVTGGEFAIADPSTVAADAPQIVVGWSPRTRELLPDVDAATLGSDSIVIRTVGSALVLAGGQPRGTIYAVNTFLEDVVGCRWWTSTESTIPRKPDLAVDDLDIAYTPPLMSREPFFKDAFEPVFATRLKANGHFARIPEELGGHVELVGWCHTFWPLLPPETYFAAHPEWYSEIDGKRSAEYTQVCLTNEDARQELTRNVLAQLRANPGARLISVTQNDWDGHCQCAACSAIEAEEGSPSGPLIRFVNAVAEDVEREFPDVLVETLAYQYTRKAPLHARPRHNVVIRLCTIECDYAHPLRSDANAGFRSDIEAWGAIAENLYIWNYIVNFANFLFPHPNLRSLGDDVRLFVEHGAVSIFEQGDAYAQGGDLNELRAWVTAHLLWDPRRDSDALIREFVAGYYGPSGPAIERYLGIVHDAAEASGSRVTCFLTSTAGWLPLPALNQATEALDEALAAAGDDALLAARVRRMRLPLEHVWLARYHELRQEATLTGEAFLGPKDPAEGYERFAAALTEFGTGYYGEGRPLDSYLPILKTRCMPLRAAETPPECAGLGPTDWLDVQDSQLTLHNPGAWVELVADESASDGSAARMPGDSNQWAAQWPVLSPAVAGKQWHVYVSARCDPVGAEGTAFSLGLYDGPGAMGVSERSVTLAEAGDGLYHTYDLGPHTLREGMYVWIAPPGTAANVSHVYVDRVFLVRQAQ